MEPTTGLIIVALFSIGILGTLSGMVVWWAFRQRLMMSEAMQTVAVQQNRGLALDTGVIPPIPQIPTREMDVQSLKKRYQEMQNRGVMNEIDEELFAGPLSESDS